MLLQIDLIYSYIEGNDVNDAIVDGEVDKLIATFADQAGLPQKVFYIGNRYRDKKDYDRGIHFYELVREKWPRDESAMNSVFETGKIKIEAGDHSGVEAVIDVLIADFNDQPRMPSKLAYLGDEYFYDKDYPKAIDIWKLVLNKYPGRGPRLIPYLLGSSHERLKDYATAAKYYEQSVAEYPNCKYGWRVPYRLGLVYRELKDYERALYWFGQQNKLYSNESTSRHALMWQGNIYLFKIKDYVKAGERFQKYIETYPDGEAYAEAHLHLGACLEKMGDAGSAIDILENALAACPDSVYADEMRNKIENLKEVE